VLGGLVGADVGGGQQAVVPGAVEVEALVGACTRAASLKRGRGPKGSASITPSSCSSSRTGVDSSDGSGR
jgi:hypothetical protein